MKPSAIRETLDKRDIQLTKSLGQHFLHDANVLKRIAAAGELLADDRVLEIGPGLGPLTRLLLANAAQVLAIEKDQRLVEVLRERFADQPKLELRHADALRVLESEPHDWSDWKLVANLPYSVASPILVELALGAQPPARMTVTLQLEVAKRLAARADDDDYGVLTLLVQQAYQPAGQFRISRKCFFPEPNVDSACLTLVRRPAPLLTPELKRPYKRIVKRAFSQRRKMMRKLLLADWPPERLDAAFAALNISPQARAETITLNQFVALTKLLTTRPA
jgi:16S rRNA (adenine1518-N6/adenine1519-N6)-dimethyltransferase